MHVIVIGGGVSAAALVIHISELCQNSQTFVKITVIESRDQLWRGAAFSTTADHHLLNVPCNLLSLHPERADDFQCWIAEQQRQGRLAEKYNTPIAMHCPRWAFGEYAESAVRRAVSASSRTVLCTIRATACDAYCLSSGKVRVELACSDIPTVEGDVVVLAIGNLQPALLPFPGSEKFYSTSQRYISNPWESIGELQDIPLSADICLLGSQLTMVDVVLTLRAKNHLGTVHVISRTGSLPFENFGESGSPPYRDFLTVELPDDINGIDQSTGMGLAHLHIDTIANQLISELQCAQNAGVPWQSVIDQVRPITNALWMGLSVEERKRFLTNWRRAWEPRRHRLAPGQLHSVLEWIASGKLIRHRGVLASMRHPTANSGVEVCITDPDDAPTTFSCDFVINCTGPDLDYRRTAHPLIASLRQRGAIHPEHNGIALLVDPATGSVLTANGNASSWLFALGPPRKGTEWESIAVRDIHRQAAALAAHLSRLRPSKL